MTVRIINADVREGLAQLEDESVHMVLTSPPYWGLRDYGTGTWHGGDSDCAHRSPTMRDGHNEDRAKLAGSAATNSYQLKLAHNAAVCGKCGATQVDDQIGLEPTPEQYIKILVDVFRAVHRVLRKDGTLWLNLGDSYSPAVAAGGHGGHQQGQGANGVFHGHKRRHGDRVPRKAPKGFKPKDLMMMPARVALALQAEGWWLRSDIIWAKPNPMPESTKDRPTSAHEHVFLLAKQQRYFYDADAVREAHQEPWRSTGKIEGQNAAQSDTLIRARFHRKGAVPREYNPAGRNLRNVWNIGTCAFSEAHFATFPPELAERCIKGGCPKGGTVLDPFGGAGTTGLVADRLERNAILIELNPDYCEMARRRIEGDAPMFVKILSSGIDREPAA